MQIAMENDHSNRGNLVSLPTMMDSHPHSGSQASLPRTLQDDFTMHDFDGSMLVAAHGHPIKLAKWQDAILYSWYAEHRRTASDMEMLCFHGLLKTSEHDIKARLSQFIGVARSFPNLAGERRLGATADQQLLTPARNSRCNDSMPTVHVRGKYVLATNRNWTADETRLRHASAETSSSGQENELSQPNTYEDQGTSEPRFPYGVLPRKGHLSSRSTTSQCQRNSCHTVRSGDNYHSNYAPDIPFLWNYDTIQQPSTSAQPEPAAITLRTFIESVIQLKIAKGCGPVRGQENQKGMYSCTLGCGRRFRTAADLIRHEEVVYPQSFWFCFQCGDVENPRERHLFTREDKMRKHIRDSHPSENISAYKVANARTTYPDRCDLCLHHKHRDWKERSKHIIWHCKKGDVFSKVAQKPRSKESTHASTSAQDDDDDSDNDDDDDQDDGDHNSRNEASHEPPNGPPDNDRYDDESGGGGAHQESIDFNDFCNWVSPSFWESAIRILLNQVPGRIGGEDIETLDDSYYRRTSPRSGQKDSSETLDVIEEELSMVWSEAPRNAVSQLDLEPNLQRVDCGVVDNNLLDITQGSCNDTLSTSDDTILLNIGKVNAAGILLCSNDAEVGLNLGRLIDRKRFNKRGFWTEPGVFPALSYNWKSGDTATPYAILSHTWADGQEVTYNDLLAGTGTDKDSYSKIRFCGERVATSSCESATSPTARGTRFEDFLMKEHSTWAKILQLARGQGTRAYWASIADLETSIVDNTHRTLPSFEMMYSERTSDKVVRERLQFATSHPHLVSLIASYTTSNRYWQHYRASNDMKSQLAVEHCYRTAEQSPETWVFWAHASNPARLEQSFQEIADQVKIRGRKDAQADTLKLVHDWLRNEKNGRWLLVLDNADDAGVLSPPPYWAKKSLLDYRMSHRKGSLLWITIDALDETAFQTSLDSVYVDSLYVRWLRDSSHYNRHRRGLTLGRRCDPNRGILHGRIAKRRALACYDAHSHRRATTSRTLQAQTCNTVHDNGSDCDADSTC